MYHDLSAAAQARCATESEGQHDDEETQHKQRGVNQADGFPTVEPYLAVNAKALHGTPKAVREMKPNGPQPHDVEHNINGIRECFLDVSEPVGGMELHVHPD